MNYILIDKTFTSLVFDSDYTDGGTIVENHKVTFIELVALMKEFYQCDSIPDNYDITNVYGKYEYYGDSEREEFLHFSDSNTKLAESLWKLARIIATT